MRAQVLRELGRPVAFYPGLARVLGIEETIFFVQLMYWSERTDNSEGWVYKTAQEWEHELALSYRQQMRVRDRLKELCILLEKNDRIKHRLYFRIDWDQYEVFAARAFGAPVGDAPPQAQADLKLGDAKARKGAPPYALIYNLLAQELPELKRRNAPARDRNIRKFWNANGRDMECIRQLVRLVKESDFLNSRNGHTFKGRLDLNWIFDPEKAEKIIAETYSNEAMAFALDDGGDGDAGEIVRVWLVSENKAGMVPKKQIGEGKAFLEVGTDERSGLASVIKAT